MFKPLLLVNALFPTQQLEQARDQRPFQIKICFKGTVKAPEQHSQ